MQVAKRVVIVWILALSSQLLACPGTGPAMTTGSTESGATSSELESTAGSTDTESSGTETTEADTTEPDTTETDTETTESETQATESETGVDPLAVVIDFDELAAFEQLTDAYSEYAIFKSTQGDYLQADPYADSVGSSPPNYICTHGVTFRCTAEVVVDFPTPIDDLTFNIVGVDTIDTIVSIRVHHGNNEIDDVPIVADMMYYEFPLHIDLSDYQSVSRIEFLDLIDAGGVGYDDFMFSVPQ